MLPTAAAGAREGSGDPLALALAECDQCLGAYLQALDQAPHPATCAACGAAWSADRRPRAAPVDVPADLEALARWLPTIAGRALPIGASGGGAAPRAGRTDFVDERHRDNRSGLRTALAALTVLDAMERAGQSRHVRVLWYAYVICGPELAARADPSAPGAGVEVLVAERFTSREQLAYWRSHKSAVVRRAQTRAHGAQLLGGARAAYEGTARGHTRAPAPPPERRQLSHELDALLARTAERIAGLAAKVANDGG